MKSFNPFNNDEVKSMILQKEGLGTSSQDQYEVLEEDTSSLKSIIEGAPMMPVSGPGKKFSNMILDASALAKNERDTQVAEITQSLNSIFTKYNESYDLDVNVNFGSLANTLVNIADDTKRRTLELYLSKTFKGIRVLIIMRLLQRLMFAIDYVTDPQRMFSSEGGLSQADLWICIDKLYDYCSRLEELKEQIEIKGDSLELDQIASDSANGMGDLEDNESKEVINEFMKLFKSDHS